MVCTSCGKKKNSSLNVQTTEANSYPLRANDIVVIENGEIRKFEFADWPQGNKLLIIIPESFTPVCKTEIGAMASWYHKFLELGCEIIAVCADPANKILDWQNSEESLEMPPYKFYSSYLLPARLGLMENGRAKRSSVFVMEDGEIIKQEHFDKVGRSMAELHRQMYAYSTDSYCGEGWKNPESGFLK